MIFLLAEMKMNGAQFWTSAMNDGINRERMYGWCPSGQLVGKDLFWGAGEPNNVFTENCVYFTMTVGANNVNFLYNINCPYSLRYICEVRPLPLI